MGITAGGQRMEVRFLYGPERFLMKFDKKAEVEDDDDELW